RDQEAVEVARLGCPGAHARRAARLRELDRALAPEVVLAAVAREVVLVRAPSELRGLAALTHQSVHGPGVNELPRHLRPARDLRVALGDVDDLDAERRGEVRPVLTALRLARLVAGVLGYVEQRLLHEVRYEARVRAVRDDSGRPVAPALAQLEHLLAERVIRAPARGDVRVGVAARPWLDAGVQVERAFFVAQLDEGNARHVDRQVQHEIAAPDERLEHVPEVLARQRVIEELDPVLRRFFATRIVRRDDRDSIRSQSADVTQDERQDALPDAGEAAED